MLEVEGLQTSFEYFPLTQAVMNYKWRTWARAFLVAEVSFGPQSLITSSLIEQLQMFLQ